MPKETRTYNKIKITSSINDVAKTGHKYAKKKIEKRLLSYTRHKNKQKNAYIKDLTTILKTIKL